MDNEKIKPLTMNQFVELLFASLSVKKDNYDISLANQESKACLPGNYLELMEKVITSNPSHHEEYRRLFDMDDYDNLRDEFEMNLAEKIKGYVCNKQIDVDFYYNQINVKISSAEADEILSNYETDTIFTMNHFVDAILTEALNQKAERELKNCSNKSIQYTLNRSKKSNF